MITESEFKRFITPLYKKLYNLSYSILKDEQESYDCLQESIVKLWENRHQFSGIINLTGYLVVTVKRNAFDHLKKKSKNPVDDLNITEENSSLSSPEKLMEDREKLNEVTALMKQLPEAQRMVMKLSSFHGLSNREISRLTGYSDENVRVLLSRGRKKLRELLKRSGI